MVIIYFIYLIHQNDSESWRIVNASVDSPLFLVMLPGMGEPFDFPDPLCFIGQV